MNGSTNDEYPVDDYLMIIYRRKFQILTAFLIIAVTSFFFFPRVPASHTAVSLLRIGHLQDPVLDAVEIEAILHSGEFNDMVLSALPFAYTRDALQDSIALDAATRQGYINLSSHHPDPEKAVRLNREAGRVLTEIVNEKYERQVNILTQYVKDIDTVLSAIDNRLEAVLKTTVTNHNSQDVAIATFTLVNSLLNTRAAMLKDRSNTQLAIFKSAPCKILKMANSTKCVEVMPRNYILGLTIVFGFVASVLFAFVSEGLERTFAGKRRAREGTRKA